MTVANTFPTTPMDHIARHTSSTPTRNDLRSSAADAILALRDALAALKLEQRTQRRSLHADVQIDMLADDALAFLRPAATRAEEDAMSALFENSDLVQLARDVRRRTRDVQKRAARTRTASEEPVLPPRVLDAPLDHDADGATTFLVSEAHTSNQLRPIL